MRKIYKILVGSFLLALIVIALLGLIAKDRTFSEKENRNLEKFPKLSLASLADGTLELKLEKYFSDQFPGREAGVSFYTGVSQAMGANLSKGVYKGQGGYLIQKFETPDEENLAKQMDAVNLFASKYPDTKQFMLVAPTASGIWQNKLPQGAPNGSEADYLSDIKGSLGENITFIDVSAALSENASEKLYYKTDHHWTTRGAFYAYQAAEETLGIDGSADSFEVQPVTTGFQGTLAATSGYDTGTREEIEVYFHTDEALKEVAYYDDSKEKQPTLYDKDALANREKYEVFFGGNHPLVEINTTSNTKKNLLVVKDSYANCFIPFLTPYYQKITVVDPRYFYDDIDELMKTDKITDVLYLYNADTFSKDTSLSPVLRNK